MGHKHTLEIPMWPRDAVFLKVTLDRLGCPDMCFLACFEAYLGHFATLYVPKTLKIELFRDQRRF